MLWSEVGVIDLVSIENKLKNRNEIKQRKMKSFDATASKNLLHRNMSVQQELQWLLQRNGPMGKKSLLNPMIAVIRLFFTNFQG